MTVAQEPRVTGERLGERGRELYEQLRARLETPANIGKIIVMDVESGDYEIDDLGINSSLRLKERHPRAALYALRIGYEALASLDGELEREDERHGERAL